MIDCETHGLSPSILCCPHVRDAVGEGRACAIAGYIFDAYDNGFLVCPECLPLARQYVVARTDEEIEACLFRYLPQCEEHIEQWLVKMNSPSLDTLMQEERKRTGRPSES